MAEQHLSSAPFRQASPLGLVCFTRILSAEVGPKGRVYAFQPAKFVKFRAAYADEQKAVTAAYSNVTPISTRPAS